MANELYPTGAGTIVLGKTESTYGTDASIADANVLYMDEFTAEVDEEVIQREGLSPQGPGFIPAMGRSLVNVSLSTEIALPTLDGTPAVTDVDMEPVLNACQFAGSVDNTDKSATFVFTDYGKQGSTFYFEMFNDADDEGQRVKCLGTVLSPTLSFEAGQRLVLAGDGQALGFQATGDEDDVILATGGGRRAVTYPSAEGHVAMGATCKIYDGTNLYGGGTLGTPGDGLAVRSFEFAGNLSVSPQLAAQPSGGVQRIRGYRDAFSTISLGLEVTDLAEFNPYALKHDQTAIQVNVLFNEGTNHLQFLSQGFITGVSMADADGRRTYDLEIQCAYPEDYSDGSPATGITPGQVFVAGTNEGLALDPATPLTAVGIAVLQFYTE